MPLIAGDHLAAGVLIGSHHLPPLFRVELAGQHGRVHQITEQHGELAAFGLWRGSAGWSRRLRLRRLERWCWWRASLLKPDQHCAFLVHGHPLHLDEFHLQVGEIVVLQTKLALKGPIGHATVPAEELDDLFQHRIKVHHRPSICASAASAWGSQKVMSMLRYSSMAVDSSARACSRGPIVAYKVPRPRWQCAWSGRMPSSSAKARA